MSLCRLDERGDGDELQEYLLEKTGQRSVPNIFISE
jgi:glutaredoxin 3